jgi:hypothetical protein
MTPRPAAAPMPSAGASAIITTNTNRREVEPLQASAVGPVRAAVPTCGATRIDGSLGGRWVPSFAHGSTPSALLARGVLPGGERAFDAGARWRLVLRTARAIVARAAAVITLKV